MSMAAADPPLVAWRCEEGHTTTSRYEPHECSNKLCRSSVFKRVLKG